MQIQPFRFNGTEVRTVSFGNEVMFVAKDVASILGYADTPKAIKSHCKAYRPVGVGGSPTLDPQTLIIPERDVYRLVMRSKLPNAEKFEEWVVGEVLPAIINTGSYQVTKSPALPGTYIEALEALVASEKSKAQLQAKNTELAPKAAFFDAVAASDDMIPIGTAAKALRLPYGRTTLFAKLRADNILMEDNEPYQKYVDAGYFVVRQGVRIGSSGKSHITHTTKVTGKGMDFLRRRYCSNDGELGLL